MANDNIRDQYVNRAVNLLTDIIKENLLENSNAIVRNGDSISAFKYYRIVKTEKHAYSIYKKNQLATIVSSTRIALAWCIYDKHKQSIQSHQLISRENELIRRQSEMMHYRYFINSVKITQKQREITIDRLDDTKDRYRSLQKQIDKCINVAKYCQQKGFDNETIRPGIVAG